MHGSNAYGTFWFWYEMSSQEKHRTTRFISLEVKKKSSCKAPLVYRMEALKHYTVEIVKVNPCLIQSHISEVFPNV